MAFLDFIINWVNNPTSERGLVLFGQAGTGKSCIAHEVARLFNDMHHHLSFFGGNSPLGRPITCLRRLLTISLTAILRFKIVLENVVKDNTALRVVATPSSFVSSF